MTQAFEVENIKVKGGEKVSTFLTVAERPLEGVDIPITIANGLRSGPVLCVIAGEHPNEYAGIEACIRLSKNIHPSELSGTLIVLPIINVLGFQERSAYVNPVDGVNLYPIWPGKQKEGSISHIMVYNVFHKVIEKAEYLIDLHGGDICESMIPCIFVPKTRKKEPDETALHLAKIFGRSGIEYIIEGAPLEKEKEETAGELIMLMAKRGIPAIEPEAGTGGKVEEKDVAILYNGILNVMKDLGMIEGKPSVTVEPQVVGLDRRSSLVTSEKGGLLYSFVEAGDIVSDGDILGEIRNVKGETIEKIVAPHKGKIFFKINPLPWDSALGFYLYYIVDVET